MLGDARKPKSAEPEKSPWWRGRLWRPGAERPGNRRPLAVVDGDLLMKLDRLALALGTDLIHGLLGEHRATRRTVGIEFADYRPYSSGDDPRRVDWNAYARLGTLHIRQAQAEHETALYLLVDGSPSMAFGDPPKFLIARRLAAALSYIALSHLDSLIVAAPGAQIGPAVNPAELTLLRGRAQAGTVFRYLDGLRPGASTTFDPTLAGWTVTRRPGRVAVIISDLLLDGYRDGIRHLVASGFRVLVLHLLSPEELHPADTGDLELIDSETGQPLELHLGAESLAEYGRRLDAWRAEIEGWCREAGAGYVLGDSTWDVERVLLETLRRQGAIA
jgi:uncharacterized protein (DUF58 family)